MKPGIVLLGPVFGRAVHVLQEQRDLAVVLVAVGKQQNAPVQSAAWVTQVFSSTVSQQSPYHWECAHENGGEQMRDPKAAQPWTGH